MDTFSKRNSINIEPADITIRFEAPMELREWVFSLVMRLGFSMSKFRSIVCQMSFQSLDSNQYSENNFMASEIRTLLEKCKWNYIYDIIEQTYNELPTKLKEDYQSSITDFFISNGYGWKLEGGHVLSRGDDAFEQSIQSAVLCIETSNPDAYSEIRESLRDISKRPESDITGAIQHSMAAVECLCRNILTDERPTLGDLIKKHRYEFSKPLDEAMEKLWGFASEKGRHLKEGKLPTFEEAELVVHICASLITFFKRTNNVRDHVNTD